MEFRYPLRQFFWKITAIYYLLSVIGEAITAGLEKVCEAAIDSVMGEAVTAGLEKVFETAIDSVIGDGIGQVPHTGK